MSNDAPKVRNARYRPFRAVALGAYLVVVLTFSGLVILSVVRSVLNMTPHQPPTAMERLTATQCAARAQELYEQLEARRQGLSSVEPAAEASLRWTAFRVAWGNGLRQAQAELRRRPPGPGRLQPPRDAGEPLHHAAVQYSGEMGPAVDAFRRALSRLREGGR